MAKAILEKSDGDVSFSEDMDVVDLNGSFTIDELHAILQLMEYEA